MAFKIFGLLAFAAVAGAQSGIGYYGQHLQKQVEVQPEYSYQQQPQVQEQEELQYQPQTQVYQEQPQQVQIQQQQIQIQQVQPQQVHYQPQQQQKHYHHHEEEHHAPAHYQFTYGVHDDHTGDVHGQQESRSGDKTEGQYYLIDADGHKRIVTYQVHGKSGFVAQVQREPIKGYQASQQHQQHYQQQHHHHQEQQQQQQEYY